jgi:hypothetical protein
MRLKATQHVLTAIGFSAACALSNIAHAGEPCKDNFSTTGNVITGKTYKTLATVANISPREAVEGALQFTANNGFTVLSSDKNAGTISAAQTVNMRNGKTVPLTIVMKADGANTIIAMSYLTPLGVMSPEEAIRQHFCNTVNAAANSPRTPVAVAVVAPAIIAPIITPPAAPMHPVAPIEAASVAAAPRPIRRGAPVGYAEITAEQKQAIESALMKNVPNDKIRDMVKEAAPAITLMAERMGCLADNKGTSGLNELAAPNVNYGSALQYNYPMYHAKYHDKSSCLTVIRVSGWIAPANNALRYEVLFKADDSGETHAIKHETVRQPDSSWLFTFRNDF